MSLHGRNAATSRQVKFLCLDWALRHEGTLENGSIDHPTHNLVKTVSVIGSFYFPGF